MAIVIVASSITYTIDFHYCQGQLKSFSLLGTAKNCHEMAEMMASCPHHQASNSEDKLCAEDEKDCCSNETVHVESDIDQQQENIDELNFEVDHLKLIFASATLQHYQDYSQDYCPYKKYQPPLIQRDLPVLFESFLL